jgi:hypothetical protein
MVALGCKPKDKAAMSLTTFSKAKKMAAVVTNLIGVKPRALKQIIIGGPPAWTKLLVMPESIDFMTALTLSERALMLDWVLVTSVWPTLNSFINTNK